MTPTAYRWRRLPRDYTWHYCTGRPITQNIVVEPLFGLEAGNAHDELVEALAGLLACPSIADVDNNDPEWGCGETAAAESKARAALAKAGAL